MPSARATKVLLVDDDADVRVLLATTLRQAGFDVHTAKDGKGALQVALAEGPPIIVTDWQMPVMDGIQLCRAIREHEGIAFSHIIVMTGDEDEERAVAALDTGADEFLVKPVRRKELLARIRVGERIVNLQHTLERRNREVHRFNAEMAIAYERLDEANARLKRLVTTDELTGLPNRRAAIQRLDELWFAARRYQEPLTCVIIDIDHFKACNDTFGHTGGDLVLKETAKILGECARREEMICRFGGEEFLLMCPKASEKSAFIVAERLRGTVQAHLFRVEDVEFRITISLGVAEMDSLMNSPSDLLRSADEALYAAKQGGRNQVCLASTRAGYGDSAGPDDPSAIVRTETDEQPVDSPFSIVLVTSDSQTRKLCTEPLSRHGHLVREANAVEQALNLIAAEQPDVVLVDVGAPTPATLQTVRRIKFARVAADVPVVLIAERLNVDAWKRIHDIGVDEFLAKPVEPNELLLRVQTVVGLRRELLRSNAVRGEQCRALDLLVTFSRRLAASRCMFDVLDTTVGVAAALTGCRRVSLLLPDDLAAELRVCASLGIGDAASTVVVPIGQGVSGSVFATRQAISLASPEDALRYRSAPDHPLLAGAPSISTPLATPEGVVGVLNLSGRQDSLPFTELEHEYIDLIGNLAASSVHDFLSQRACDEARDSIVTALATLAEYRDSDTGRHLERVTQFCGLLSKELRTHDRYRSVITDEFLSNLQRAVPLHDIGKVAVPDGILRKPGPLSQAEIAVIRTHTQVGATTIRSVMERTPGAPFLKMAEQIALSHHEWFDGRGYPQGLKGEETPLAARIVAVADVYDALTTRRPYKAALSHAHTVEFLVERSGTQFDPDVIEAFRRCEKEFVRLAKELGDAPAKSRGEIELSEDFLGAGPFEPAFSMEFAAATPTRGCPEPAHVESML